jgi:hypothetical protein
MEDSKSTDNNGIVIENLKIQTEIEHHEGHMMKKISLTKELLDKQRVSVFDQKCTDLEYRIRKVEENLEKMIKSMVQKKIIVPTKSLQSLACSEKSEVMMTTLDLNKKSSAKLRDTAEVLQDNVEKIEKDFEQQLNTLLDIKSNLSDYTLKLSQMKNTNDSEIDYNSCQVIPSNLTVTSSSKSFQVKNNSTLHIFKILNRFNITFLLTSTETEQILQVYQTVHHKINTFTD